MCTWTWTTTNGVNGYVVRGKDEFASASIFLPAAGDGRGTSLRYAGASGCGKSTLLMILNGLSPQHFKGTLKGRLEICGTDCPAPMEQISRLVAGLLKPASGTFLFDGTIRENLLLGDPFADDEKLQDARERANLGEFVRSLPGGIDTPVGERGVRISGGQAQCIAIARVFLKNPPVLILDEATSALDTFAEAGRCRRRLCGFRRDGRRSSSRIA